MDSKLEHVRLYQLPDRNKDLVPLRDSFVAFVGLSDDAFDFPAWLSAAALPFLPMLFGKPLRFPPAGVSALEPSRSDGASA